MQGKYMHTILQKRNSKKSAIPQLSSAINISITMLIIMFKDKYKVSDLLYVSNFFFIAVNWASWWTASRDETGSPLFPVQPCSNKKLMKEKNVMALQPR